jgi:hypothetical protein
MKKGLLTLQSADLVPGAFRIPGRLTIGDDKATKQPQADRQERLRLEREGGNGLPAAKRVANASPCARSESMPESPHKATFAAVQP